MQPEYTPFAQLTLRPEMFDAAERMLFETSELQVTSFRYPSGIEALRMTTDRVEVVVLPFRGQQVWRYAVDGVDLTMHTHFDEPTRSTTFAENYGAFLLHCGLTGIGHPSPADTHAHHGELPNADYPDAHLIIGLAEEGPLVGITGFFRHRVSHTADVVFSPFLSVRPGGTALDLSITIANLRQAPFRYSYLCHVNWPIFNGRLLQTVPMDAEHVEIAPDPAEDAQTAAFTRRITDDLAASNTLSTSQPVVPEYCAILRPEADQDGWAHFMMTGDDGRAAAVSFEVEQLPYAIRWISNTGDEQAAGFCLPATANHKGRLAAEAAGMVREIPGNGEVTTRITIDYLDAEASAERERLIGDVLAR